MDLQRGKRWAFQVAVQVTDQDSDEQGLSASQPERVRHELGVSDLRAPLLTNILILIRIPHSLNLKIPNLENSDYSHVKLIPRD